MEATDPTGRQRAGQYYLIDSVQAHPSLISAVYLVLKTPAFCTAGANTVKGKKLTHRHRRMRLSRSAMSRAGFPQSTTESCPAAHVINHRLRLFMTGKKEEEREACTFL